MRYGDIYCDIVFGANIGGFEAYCCNGVIVGRNLEQNLVGVTLVVQNFSEIFCIDFVGLSGSPCILNFIKLGQNEPFLLTI